MVLAFVAPASAQPLLGLRPGGTPAEGPADFDPTGVWWNPAAIGPLRGFHFIARGQLGLERGSYDRSAISSATGVPGDGANLHFASAPLSSNHLGYFGAATWDFGFDTFTLGVAVYSPWSDGRSFTEPKSGFVSTELPSGYHLVSESFHNTYISFAAAVRLHPRFYVGVSVSPIDSSTSLDFYRDAALDGGSATVSQPSALCAGVACGYENRLAAQRISVRGDGGSFWNGVVPKPSGLGIGLGIVAQPSERVWLGLSWQHVVPLPALTSDYERPYDTPDAAGARVTPALGQNALCGGTAAAPLPCLGGDSITYSLPDVFHLGARFSVRQNLELSTWLRLVTYGGYGSSNDFALRGLVVQLDGAPVRDGHLPQRIVISHAMRPSVAMELLGLRWMAIDRPTVGKLRFALSAIYETPSVPADNVDAATIDGHKLDATLGIDFRRVVAGKAALRFAVAAGLTGYLPVSANPGVYDPRARVNCVDHGASLDSCGLDLNGQALPSAAGRYALVAPHFTVGVGVDY